MSTEYRRAARRRKGLPTWRMVRYAGDFAVLVNGSGHDAEALREQIAGVLAEAKTWVSRSAMAGMPSLRSFPDPPGLGIIRSRTGSGRNEPSLRAARRSSRNPGTPVTSLT